MTERSAVRLQIHDTDPRVAGLLRMIDLASAARPLPHVLEGLCQHTAELVPADVVSVYVREPGDDEDGEDVLVMRGNVGFPPGAVGHVRLGLGEGITGFAAEHLWPVSVDAGPASAPFKPVPGLGEERFPAFLAIPLVRAATAEGVLVLQRAPEQPFVPSEVAFATALAAPFLQALAAARARHAAPRARRPAGRRQVSLSGHALAPGAAVGRMRPLPSLDALGREAGDVAPAEVQAAFASLVDDLGRTLRRLKKSLAPAHAAELSAVTLLLDDARLRSELVDACRTHGALRGLREVIRSYALTPLRTGQGGEGGAWLAARAGDVEHLCLLLAAAVADRPVLEGGDALVIGGEIGPLVALSAVGHSAAAVVVGDRVDDASLAVALLCAAGVPAVSEVAGLLDWARPGDAVLVDGNAGLVRVHPAPTHLARLRTSARA